MKLEKFMNFVKKCKKSTKLSGQKNLFVYVNKEHTRMTITEDKMNKIDLTLATSHMLTIFECATLVSIFCENKIPVDYASWHKTKSGQEFINNIEKIGRFMPRTLYTVEEVDLT
jgi:hypothetical protein